MRADSPLTLGTQLGLAQNLIGVGDFRGAEATAREALAVYRTQPANRQVVTVLMALGDALAGQRRFTEAIPYLREANALFDKGGPRRTPWYKPEAQSSLGAALAGAGDRADAERLLLAGYQGLHDLPSTPGVRLRASIERLIAFYAASGRRHDAAEWRKRLLAVGPTGQRVEASAVR